MATQGGPAKAVSVQLGGQQAGGPALPVAVVTDGRAVEGGPAQPIYIVTSGQVQGGPAAPVVVAATGSAVSAGPAIPAYVVSGSFSSALDYTNKVIAAAPSSLIGYWPLAESSGGTATDESGNGRNGSYTGVTLGAAGIGDGRTAASFDGAASFANIFSAGLAGAFSPTAGTLSCWMRVANAGVWTDATLRRGIMLQADANNRIHLSRTTTNNQLQWAYSAGGSAKSRTKSPLSNTDWAHLACTWSSAGDQFIAYYNGVQEGIIINAIGTWAGALANTTTDIGAGATTPAAVWSGTLAHVALWSTVLSPAQIATLAVVP